jgi:hypothetical protein
MSTPRSMQCQIRGGPVSAPSPKRSVINGLFGSSITVTTNETKCFPRQQQCRERTSTESILGPAQQGSSLIAPIIFDGKLIIQLRNSRAIATARTSFITLFDEGKRAILCLTMGKEPFHTRVVIDYTVVVRDSNMKAM